MTYPNATTVRTAASMSDRRHARLVLAPRYEHQAQECYKAYELAWRQGGWTVYADERFYHEQELGLKWPLNRLDTQGRSKKLSLISGMQRPVDVSRYAMGEARHIISFGLEGRDVKTLRDATSPRLADTVTDLGMHEFAWFYRPTRRVWRGRLQDLYPQEG